MNFATDLIRLLPRKFRTVERLQDFLQSCGEILDELTGKINGLEDLFDPDTVPDDYVQHLADILGYRVVRIINVGTPQEESTRRRVLKSIVDLIKEKGLKTGILNLMYYFYLLSDVLIYELYTNDYVSFTGPDRPAADYYLTPHFLVLLPLDIYTRFATGSPAGTGEGRRLVADMLARLDENRPAHTVLHYDLGALPNFWRVGGPYNRVGVDLRVGGLVLVSV